MITSLHKNIRQNQNIVIGNLSFENVGKFKYLGVMVKNTNYVHEVIKLRVNMVIACYYSIENVAFSLLSKKIKANTYKDHLLV